MHKTLTLFCLICCFLAKGQITLRGKAVDRETREPLTFASVSIQGKSRSTITNLEGEFEFHIPSEYQNEILVISMLGYKNYESPVWSVISPGQVIIPMERSVTMLDEVIFTDSLSAAEIVQLALRKIPQNYPMKPFLMNGFYRDVKRVAGTYISLLEAAVKIYDENYRRPRNQFKLRENVELVEVRRSLGYESKFTAYFDQENLLEDLLLQNDVRYHLIPTEKEFLGDLTREPNTFYDNHEVFVIRHDRDFNLQLYVDTETYSILFLKYESNLQHEYQRKRGMVSRFVHVKRELAFRKFEGRLFPNYMSVTSQINWYDINTNDLKFETELIQQLLINDVEADTKARISSSRSMKNYGLQYQHLDYNKTFWDNYNVILRTPLDKKIIQDLERIAPLEKQFEEN